MCKIDTKKEISNHISCLASVHKTMKTPNIIYSILHSWRTCPRRGLVSLEALVARVLFVIVVLWHRLQLFWQRCEHFCENRIDRFLVGPVTVPNHDEVRIEADTDGDTADVIT